MATLKDLVNTAIPSGDIRCDACMKTHSSDSDNSHYMVNVFPGFEFCAFRSKFTTWTQLAVPNNFLVIPNIGGE